MRRFLRLFKCDARNGVCATGKTVIAICLFLLLLVLSFYVRIGDMALADEVSIAKELVRCGPFSSGDYLAYLLAGKGPWLASDGEPFKFPAAWMVLFGLFLYMTLWYPFKDLRGMGALVLVAGQSRWLWWLSKCLWVAMCSTAIIVLLAAVAVFWAVLTSGDISWVPAGRIEAILSQEPSLRPESPGSVLPFFVCALTAGLGLSMLQLALSLFVRPLLSFAACFSLLFVSVCQFNSYLLGNYLIAMRSSALMTGGMDPVVGIVLGVGVSALSVLVGGIRFSGVDLLDKEFDT